jgi:restriction system protein
MCQAPERDGGVVRRLRTPVWLLSPKPSQPSLVLSALLLTGAKTPDGLLVCSTTHVWKAIVSELGRDWSRAYEIPPDKWEEIIAGAFDRAGYDEVTLTPRSRDFGRDVIAVKHGIGSVKILGSVKAYKPTLLVPYEDIRAIVGVMASDLTASKAMITTTSDFPPRVNEDPSIKPFMPTRLELVNGKSLARWLLELNTD